LRGNILVRRFDDIDQGDPSRVDLLKWLQPVDHPWANTLSTGG
jgi:hypothetical protein